MTEMNRLNIESEKCCNFDSGGDLKFMHNSVNSLNYLINSLNGIRTKFKYQLLKCAHTFLYCGLS